MATDTHAPVGDEARLEDFRVFERAARERHDELIKLLRWRLAHYHGGRRVEDETAEEYYESALCRGFEKEGTGIAQVDESQAANLVWGALSRALDRKLWSVFCARGDAADPGRRDTTCDDWLAELQDRRVDGDDLVHLLSYQSEILDVLPPELNVIVERVFMGFSRDEVISSLGLLPEQFDAAFRQVRGHLRRHGLADP